MLLELIAVLVILGLMFSIALGMILFPTANSLGVSLPWLIPLTLIVIVLSVIIGIIIVKGRS